MIDTDILGFAKRFHKKKNCLAIIFKLFTPICNYITVFVHLSNRRSKINNCRIID